MKIKATSMQMITLDGQVICLGDGNITYNAEWEAKADPTLFGYPITFTEKQKWPEGITIEFTVTIKNWHMPPNWFAPIKTAKWSEYLQSMQHGDKEVMATYPRLLETTRLIVPKVRRFNS